MNRAAQLPERDQLATSTANDRQKSRRRQQGSVTRGKVLLVVIFCVLRGVDLLMYFGTTGSDKTRLLASIITTGIWTTALLVGIWKRQNWARYFLIVLVLLGVFAYALFTPDVVQDKGTGSPLLAVFIIAGAANAGIAFCLIRSRHIRRLCQRGSA